MSKDAFENRGRALEDAFFREVDEKLAAELKDKLSTEMESEALGEATGLTDKTLLKELVELGLNAETVLAISLVPLVLVSWADGNVTANERSAILEAAKTQGMTDGSPAARMLKHWLNAKPDKALGTTWVHYIQTIYDDMDGEAQAAIVADFDRRTHAIAQASGGVLGFGKTSDAEQKVIDDLRKAF